MEEKAESQEDNYNATETPNNDNQDDLDDASDIDSFSKEYVKKLREENSKWRRNTRELEDKFNDLEKQRKLEEMNEVERAKAIAQEAETKRAEIERRFKEMQVKTDIIELASDMGFRNPSYAAKILDVSMLIGDEYSKENVLEKLEELKINAPYLIKPTSTPKGPGESEKPSRLPEQSELPTPKFTDANRLEKMKSDANQLRREGNIVDAVKLYNKAWELENRTKR